MKTFSQFLLEANDPKGPIKKYMSPEEIAKKHKLSMDTINSQLEMGIKIESEHTGSKQMARMIALQHLEELPDYYSRLKKVETKKSPVKEGKEESRYCPACQKAETRGECKMGPKYWDKFAEAIKEETASGDETLGDWFRKSSATDPKTGRKVPGWRQLGGKYAGAPCARQPGQTSTPKCGSSKMAANLSDEEEEAAFRRKNRKDPNQPEKSGAAKPTNVATEETIVEKRDACYNKVKSRYSVWPSAYASGALVKCRKVGAKNWGNKSESTDFLAYDWDFPMHKNSQRYCPKCQKTESIGECKYGPKFWLLYSSPIEPSDEMKDDISRLYTKKESYDYSNWREEFKATEYEFTDLIKPEPIKSSTVRENYTRIQSRGTTYSILLNWRGKTLGVQMFFPQFTRPTKEQVTYEVCKIYPEAKVLSYNPSIKDPTKPLLFTGDLNGSK
jgi:cytochrome c2